jgi:hypothetical protein
LVPTASGGLVSISALSTWNATSATFIFRCQNCSVQETESSGGFGLKVFQSYKLPDYPSPDALNATLNVEEATISGLALNDIELLRSVDYDMFLSAAGLA